MPDDILNLLIDAVHYDRFRSPFSGNGGQFACLYATDGPIGIGPLHARASQFTRLITQATLQLWIEHDGHWQAVHRQQMRSHPARAEETAHWRVGGTELSIETTTVYEDERTAWHRQTITNTGKRAITFRLASAGQVDPDREIKDRTAHVLDEPVEPRIAFAEAEGKVVRCGYRGDKRLPRPAVQIEATEGIERAQITKLPHWAGDASPADAVANRPTRHFAFHSKTITLEFGRSHQCCYRISYVPTWHASPDHHWPDVADTSPSFDALLERASEEARATLHGSAHDSQLARARYTLLRCSYRGRDAAYGDNRSCLCTPGITAFSITFFWDALFSSAAISGFDAAYARDALRVPLRKVNGRWAQRNWDCRIAKNERVPQPQAPVASWALSHHLALHDDHAFVNEMYPTLVDLHRFWETQDADGDGLPEWRFTGLNADNGPHYAPYMPPGVHNVYIPPIASVSLASFLHLDALLLADFAKRLGKPDEADTWRQRATFLADRIKEICWHAEDGCFYDFDHHMNEHRRVRTHLIFWPIWAGVPMPEDDKQRLITRLLDPAQYNGPIPFPTCAYDDRHYNAESYWSGRSWPHISYWLVEMLVREGYRDEARAMAARWLAWQSAHTGHREAVTTDPHLSEHCENTDFTYRTGRDFDYNWAAAAVALFREPRYERFVPLVNLTEHALSTPPDTAT